MNHKTFGNWITYVSLGVYINNVNLIDWHLLVYINIVYFLENIFWFFSKSLAILFYTSSMKFS